MPEYVYEHMCRCLQKPEEGSRSVELELKVVMSHLMWGLETEFKLYTRAAGALNC